MGPETRRQNHWQPDPPFILGGGPLGPMLVLGPIPFPFGPFIPCLFLSGLAFCDAAPVELDDLQWLRLFCLRLVHLCVFRRLLTGTSHPHPQTNHMSSDGHSVQVYRFYMTQGIQFHCKSANAFASTRESRLLKIECKDKKGSLAYSSEYTSSHAAGKPLVKSSQDISAMASRQSFGILFVVHQICRGCVIRIVLCILR